MEALTLGLETFLKRQEDSRTSDPEGDWVFAGLLPPGVLVLEQTQDLP